MPSPYLYPHQWSWDSACIAMGYAPGTRIEAERSFARCSPASGATGCCRTSSSRKATGAISQAPTSGRQAGRRTPQRGSRRQASSSLRFTPLRLAVYQRSPDRRKRVRSSKTSRRSLPPGMRTCTASGRVGGRTRGDLASVGVGHGQLPPLGRGADADPPVPGRDPRVPAGRRPAGGSCGAPDRRRVRPVRLPRRALPPDLDYLPDRIREATPFALQSALFNSLLVQSNRDLAAIARLLGDDPEPFESWAAQTAAGVDESSGTRKQRSTSTTTCRRSDASACGQPRVSRRSMPESRPTSGRGG